MLHFVRVSTNVTLTTTLCNRERANGVFLWVHLVVRSLLDGLTEDDDIPMLRTRLRALPPTLEEYFEAMLKSIDPIYKRYTARALLTACSAEQPLSTASYYYLSTEIPDANYALKMPVEAVNVQQVYQRRKSVVAWINKWCRDLLEVPHFLSVGLWGTAPNKDPHVEFLHRTVRDFLITQDMQLFLEKNAGHDFNAQLSLCRSYLAQAKTAIAGGRAVRKSFYSLADSVMFHAKEYELQDQKTPFALLQELDRVGNVHAATPGAWHWTGERPQRPKVPTTADFEDDFEDAGNFLLYAKEFQLRLFVKEVLRKKLWEFGNIQNPSLVEWASDQPSKRKAASSHCQPIVGLIPDAELEVDPDRNLFGVSDYISDDENEAEVAMDCAPWTTAQRRTKRRHPQAKSQANPAKQPVDPDMARLESELIERRLRVARAAPRFAPPEKTFTDDEDCQLDPLNHNASDNPGVFHGPRGPTAIDEDPATVEDFGTKGLSEGWKQLTHRERHEMERSSARALSKSRVRYCSGPPTESFLEKIYRLYDSMEDTVEV